METLHRNGTCKLDTPPSGVGTFPSRIILKLERNSGGLLGRFNRGVVARGNFQYDLADYLDLYAPVLHLAGFSTDLYCNSLRLGDPSNRCKSRIITCSSTE